MASTRRELYVQFNQLGDALVIAAVFWASHALRDRLAVLWPSSFPGIAPFSDYKWLYLIILPSYPFLLDINGYYARPFRGTGKETWWILLKSGAQCALIVIAAMYFLQLTGLSRGVIILFASLSVVVLGLKDALLRLYFHADHRRKSGERAVLLVGPADRNAEFEKLLTDHPEWGLTVEARLDPSVTPLTQLPSLLHERAIGCVIFNVSRTYFDEVEKAVLACEIEGVEAWLTADFMRTSIARPSIADFHGKPILMFRSTPAISWQLIVKRLMDIVGAGLGLLILGPLVMVPVAIGIRLTSPGPILFRQKRSGLHGREFTMYKFRSMVDNAEMLRVELETFNEMTGPVFKMKRDPRVTPFGRFLRKTSIDELPQLWNVLKGEMSLVGPRPPIPTEVAKYDTWHRRRLSMKPGLTCLWQISGRNGIGFDQWMKLDLEYIDHWSLWLDLKILARTIPVVLSGLGAH